MSADVVQGGKLSETQVELSIENLGWGAMLLKEMDMLRGSQYQCDIAVMASDGTKVPAHSVVLSAASSFFKKVFETAKVTNPSACNIVIKCHYTADVIRTVFDFLYRGKVMPVLSQIPEIQRAAKTFGIVTLTTLCEVFTTKNEVPDSNQELVFRESSSECIESTLPEAQAEEFHNGDDQGRDEGSLEEGEPMEGALSETAVQSVESMTLEGSETLTSELYNVEVPSESLGGNVHVLHPEIIRQNVSQEYNVNTSYKKVYRYKCDLCERILTSRSRLEGHRATHSGEKLHVCKICGADFIQIEYLREHQSMHYDARPHKCSICGLEFRLLRHLKKHTKVHSSNKPFKCKTCGASFRRSDGWRNHLRTHTGEKPYPCEFCGRIFSLAESLKRHELVHSRIRPYKCGVCSVTFRRKDALCKHVTIHSGERPFVCQHPGCTSSFRMKVQLHRHLDIFHKTTLNTKTDTTEVSQSSPDVDSVVKSEPGDDNGEIAPESVEQTIMIEDGPYKCTVCSADFISKETLRKHVPIHLSEHPFVCQHRGCSSSFHNKVQLRNHLDIFHKDTLNTETNTTGTEVSQSSSNTDSVMESQACGDDEKNPPGLVELATISDGRYRCMVCSAAFRSKDALHNHVTDHSDAHCFVCQHPGCCRSFRLKMQLRHHVAIFHQNTLYTKTATTEVSQSSQKTSHSAVLPFVCQQVGCSSSFRLKVQLRRHYAHAHKNTRDTKTITTGTKVPQSSPNTDSVMESKACDDEGKNSTERATTGEGIQ